LRVRPGAGHVPDFFILLLLAQRLTAEK